MPKMPSEIAKQDATLYALADDFGAYFESREMIVAHLAGKAEATAFWAVSFFWLRLAHAVVYLLGIPYVRTVIFTLGYVAVVGIFWEVIS